jgi:tripartite-type tricarboxylate transporter receptor subunit TctC
MHTFDTNSGAPAEPPKKISGLVRPAALCLVLLGGFGIGYMIGFGLSDELKAPELSIATSDWRPEKPIELVVMAGEGGSADLMARVIQRIIADDGLSHQPIVVLNKGGESGGEALRYLKDKAGDPHVIMITLNTIYTTPLRQTGLGVRLEDYTPVARLAEGNFVLWVNADSRVHRFEDYLAAVRAAGPNEWKMGGAGSGQEDSFVTALLEQAYGIKHGRVAYGSGGKAAEGLAKGEVHSTISTPSEQAAEYMAGKTRPIAVFSAHRIPALPGVPTFRELGRDLVYFMQRSVVAPPNIPPEVETYYLRMLQRVGRSDEWQRYLRKAGLHHTLLPGKPLMVYLLDERERHRELLTSMGGAF